MLSVFLLSAEFSDPGGKVRSSDENLDIKCGCPNTSPKSLRPKAANRLRAFFYNLPGAENRFSKDSQYKKRNIIAIIFGVTGVRLGRIVLQMISAHKNFPVMMSVVNFYLPSSPTRRPGRFC